MPPRAKTSRNVESDIAAEIAALRAAREWTYQVLADKMAEFGYTIHPSAIQKVEAQGRRITVNELVAYAAAFDIPVARLLDHSLEASDITVFDVVGQSIDALGEAAETLRVLEAAEKQQLSVIAGARHVIAEYRSRLTKASDSVGLPEKYYPAAPPAGDRK